MTSPVRAADKMRVFLIDDHPILQTGAGERAQSTGARCAFAARQATRRKPWPQSNGLQPDLALVDLSLQSGDGIELLKDLRVRQPRMLTLVLSMHDEALYAERALRAGARGYVMKQEKLDRLLLAINRVLSGAIYVSDQVAAHAVAATGGGREQPRSTVGASAATQSLDAYVERLTDRELQVFRLIGRGLGTRLIAETLHLSRKTIESHREHIKTKLGLQGRQRADPARDPMGTRGTGFSRSLKRPVGIAQSRASRAQCRLVRRPRNTPPHRRALAGTTSASRATCARWPPALLPACGFP